MWQSYQIYVYPKSGEKRQIHRLIDRQICTFNYNETKIGARAIFVFDNRTVRTSEIKNKTIICDTIILIETLNTIYALTPWLWYKKKEDENINVVSKDVTLNKYLYEPLPFDINYLYQATCTEPNTKLNS